MIPDSLVSALVSPLLGTVRQASVCLAAVLLLVACSGAAVERVKDNVSDAVTPKSAGKEAREGFGEPAEYGAELKSLAAINIRDAKLERILPPLDYAWAFEFIDSETILLTLHGGRLLQINLSSGEQIDIDGLPRIGSGFTHIGLMDIALHPDFENNQRVYISYAKPHPEAGTYHQTEVATAILRDNSLTDLQTLINSDDFGWASSNFGGALEFDAEGYLYVSIGDRGEDPLAQRGDRLEGKILRLNDDGTAPDDNPFAGVEGFDPRIFVLGARNAQGLHFDARSGYMFEAEHGQLGGDEVNLLRAGSNYGHPTVSYGANYVSGKPIGEGTHKAGMEQPLYYFVPSIAASRILMYRGEMFPEWDGDLFVTALKGAHIARLDFDEGVVRTHQPILNEVGGRIRDLKVAGDGSIYILSQTTGLHRLYRPPPAPPAVSTGGAAPRPPVNAPHPGKQYYDIVCSGCHDSGATGAPILGDYARWKPIIEQPMELTRERVMKGYNAMPERGLCHSCSDGGLMQMVDYMFEEAKKNAP